jgi:hypothetical protein
LLLSPLAGWLLMVPLFVSPLFVSPLFVSRVAVLTF